MNFYSLTRMKDERLRKKPEGASEILSWVNRSRKIEEKRNSEKTKALRRSKIFEEQVRVSTAFSFPLLPLLSLSFSDGPNSYDSIVFIRIILMKMSTNIPEKLQVCALIGFSFLLLSCEYFSGGLMISKVLKKAYESMLNFCCSNIPLQMLWRESRFFMGLTKFWKGVQLF